MRHLFIVDPLPSLAPTKDTSVLFMAEAARRGHEVVTACVGDLSVGDGGRPLVRSRETVVDGEALRQGASWFRTGEPRSEACADFDVVWMRKDPPVDLAFLRVVQILALIPPPTLVVNDPEGILAIDEKLFVLRFPELAPPTLISRDRDELLAFRQQLGGEMILKPIGGCGGEGVFHLRKDEHNLSALIEMTTQHGREFQIAQRYVPEIRKGDKRVIVLDGEPVGAVLRVPAEAEARANFHAGGSAVRATITERDREICARIGPALRERGILFAGIDVIGDYLTEINVTSPTGLQEINALDGVRLEAGVLDVVCARRATRD